MITVAVTGLAVLAGLATLIGLLDGSQQRAAWQSIAYRRRELTDRERSLQEREAALDARTRELSAREARLRSADPCPACGRRRAG